MSDLRILRPAAPPPRRRSVLDDLWWTALTGITAGLALASFAFGAPLWGWIAALVAWRFYRAGEGWSR